MFTFPPDAALQLAHERMADDHRKADERRRVLEARRAQSAPRGRVSPGRMDPTSGAEIRIVEAGPAHQDAMLALLRRLSPQTSYRRFITSAEPADVVDVPSMLTADPCHRAVVALRRQEIVGHALAVASPDGGTVELGVVVADEWQGNGLGTRLIRALLETDPAAMASELEFLVLSWNAPARRLIKRVWPDTLATRDGQLIHYRVRTGTGLESAGRWAPPCRWAAVADLARSLISAGPGTDTRGNPAPDHQLCACPSACRSRFS